LVLALWLPLVSLTICVGLTLLYLLPPPQPPERKVPGTGR